MLNDPQSMRYMGLGLGFGAPAPMPKTLGESRAYVPNITDRMSRIEQTEVKVERIESALSQAALGYMRPVADINDLIFTHPIVKGLRKHLKAGIKRYMDRLQVSPPANVAPARAQLAQTIADDVRREIENSADAAFSSLVGDHIECELRGGGLVEILWKRTPDNRWHWAGFDLVPQQRQRFDRPTGEPCLAGSPFQFYGEPVSAFPRGTFVAATPEKAVPDFSKRGTCRSILSIWFAMQNIAGWWQDDLERLGSGILAVMYENDSDRETMNKAIREIASNAGIAYRKGGDVKLLEKSSRTGPKGSAYNEFEAARVQWMSIAFLGAAQTVTIDANTGSQQSSDNMAEVADDVVADCWEHFFADVRRDLVQVLVELNYGLENADLTPILGMDLEEAADANETLDAYTKGDAIGLKVGEDAAYKKLKWAKPGPGEKTLGKPAADPATVDAPAQGSGPRLVPAPGDGTRTNQERA